VAVRGGVFGEHRVPQNLALRELDRPVHDGERSTGIELIGGPGCDGSQPDPGGEHHALVAPAHRQQPPRCEVAVDFATTDGVGSS